MTGEEAALRGGEGVAVLFHPSVVPVLDAFRSLDFLDGHYDLRALLEPERSLLHATDAETARAIISDAVLLAFALNRRRDDALTFGALGSRRGSRHEYCLLSLIGAAHDPLSDVAFEAATALQVEAFDFVMALAAELLRQMEAAHIVVPRPDAAEFRAVFRKEPSSAEPFASFTSSAELFFQH